MCVCVFVSNVLLFLVAVSSDLTADDSRSSLFAATSSIRPGEGWGGGGGERDRLLTFSLGYPCSHLWIRKMMHKLKKLLG